MDNKKSKTDNVLISSVWAIWGAAVIKAIYPPYYPTAAMFVLFGVAGIYMYFATYSKFNHLWKALDLGKDESYPICKGKKRTKNSIIYRFSLPAGLSIEDFERNKIAIEQFLGRDIDIKYTYKEIWIEVFDPNQPTEYDYNIIPCKGPVEFPIGYDRQGEIVTCDLSSGEPHMLIAGETGSGKSTALRAIITNIILTKNVKLHLIDLKCGAEFQIFAKCKNVESFARTRTEAEEVLSQISAEIDRRYDLFFQHDCVNIKEYNRKGYSMGYELVIIDEFADLQRNKWSISLVEEIAAKARACGIHLIISTQRPDSTILNGRIKANVTNVLGLKTTNEINSRIIIDHDGLEKLRGKGHGIFKRGNETEVQCPNLSAEMARELVRHTYVERPPKVMQMEIENFDFLEAL